MPAWLQIIIWISVGLGAIGVIWKKLVKPGANVITKFEQATPLFDDLHTLVPLLSEFMSQFGATPGVLAVLNDMAKQFRTDSGSSLRDVINRIEQAVANAEAAAESAAKDAATAAKVFESNLEAQGRLAEQGRQQVENLTRLVRVVSAKQNVQSSQLDAQDEATAGVADDLREAHERAEAHDDDAPPGTASDAAMRREDEGP